jgi:type IV pilus assembly protein PilM
MSFSDLIGRIKGEVLVTGVDVGHSSIKFAQVEHKRSEKRLIAVDVEYLPAKTIEDNEVREPKALQDALTRLMQRRFPDGIQGEIVLGINWSNGILADRVSLRKQSDDTNEAFILEEAGKRPPFNEDGVNLDYEILSETAQGDQDVLIVAAKGAGLSAWVNLFKPVEIIPSILEVDAFAAVNIFLLSSTEDELKQTVAILNIGDKRTHISIVRNGLFHSTRTVQNASVDTFLSQMSRRIGLDSEMVGKILREESTEPYDNDLFNQALEFAADEFAVSLELALRYFTSSENQERVQKLILVGGGAGISGLTGFLTSKLAIETVCFESAKVQAALHVDQSIFGASGMTQDALNTLVTAIGLATRKP